LHRANALILDTRAGEACDTYLINLVFSTMDFSQIFNFSNSDHTIALVILLGGSFLIGFLLFWLVFHLPKTFGTRRKIKELTNDLEALRKTHANLEDEHKTVSAKVANLESDLAIAQNEIAQKIGEIVNVSNQLEIANSKLYQAQKQQNNAQEEFGELKRLYKYAQIAITESEKIAEIAQRGQQQLQNQLDQARLQTNQHELDKRQATDLAVQLQAANSQLQAANADLEQQLQTATTDLQKATTQLQYALPKAEQVDTLREQLNQLEVQKNYSENQLSTYTSKEELSRVAEAQEQALMEQHLVDAQSNMNDNPFFDVIDPMTLIEDEAKIQAHLDLPAPVAETNDDFFSEEVQQLSADEQEMFARLEFQADNAMDMPGFFQPISESALILPADYEQEQDDAQVIARMLVMAEKNIATSAFYNDIPESELVADPVLLAKNLAAIQQPTEIAEQTIIVLSEQEQAEMERALDYAQVAMQAEGFYTTIPANQLIEAAVENPNAIIIDPKYKTEIERSVVTDLLRVAPKATEGQKQDLKRINGIGSFIEQKLNHLGIYTFEQVSHFDETFIAKLTAAIGFAQDAIHRDNWVEQARVLFQNQK
jgi:predicted flap endonuclease-1-like 5' DNA nuclease